MKTKIRIPQPCTEDWNKMTPTEKGAYCDKCAFEVIDFTSQSPEEIKATLKVRMGQKTCGHISKTQMELVNSNYHLWDNQSAKMFKSKFLYACLMVFGFSLFTGCSSPEDEVTMGAVQEHVEEEIEVGMVEEDTTQCIEPDESCDSGDIILDGMMEVEHPEE